ncbi:MAG TPA: AAA family ATPase [Chloroflexota bacterium]|nr:AAA family ATPase [Chloroflexota bacterium]
MFLRSIRLDRSDALPDGYPFSVPAIATLDEIELRVPVTFFAGENASGKSTLLEGIATGIHSIPVRADDPLTSESLRHAEELGKRLRFAWSVKTRQGFFLRAEDFFEYKKGITAAMRELDDLASDADRRFSGYGRQLARGSALGQRHALETRYGEDPNARSHGESFLQFFGARFTGPGLYLLDEPDTALSTQSTIGLIALLKEMVAQGAQFLIATHSPILLAFPGAAILSFDRIPIADVPYEDVEQVTLLKSFLEHPDAFLRHL